MTTSGRRARPTAARRGHRAQQSAAAPRPSRGRRRAASRLGDARRGARGLVGGQARPAASRRSLGDPQPAPARRTRRWRGRLGRGGEDRSGRGDAAALRSPRGREETSTTAPAPRLRPRRPGPSQFRAPDAAGPQPDALDRVDGHEESSTPSTKPMVASSAGRVAQRGCRPHLAQPEQALARHARAGARRAVGGQPVGAHRRQRQQGGGRGDAATAKPAAADSPAAAAPPASAPAQ